MPTKRNYTVPVLLAAAFACFLLPIAWGQDAAPPTTPVDTVDAGDSSDVTAPTADATETTPPTDGAVAATDATDDASATTSAASGFSFNEVYYPLIVLVVGIVVVLGLIVVFKVNAFIALITAAIVVSLMAPGSVASKISRVASDFGGAAGGIGIVIGMAAVIGKCMLDSGAADRIVRFFLGVFGEKRSPVALLGSGFVLAVPVFFDTVFYLLVPLARSLHRKTGKSYLTYILAIGAGGAITHTLVPPTPGPLLMAENLGVEVGWMIIVGLLVAGPAAIVGLLVANVADRLMQTPMRTVGSEPDPEPLEDSQLPPLWLALAPVVLPVILISANTVMTYFADAEHAAVVEVADVQDWEAFEAKLREEASSEEATPGRLIAEHLRGAVLAGLPDGYSGAAAADVEQFRSDEWSAANALAICEAFKTAATASPNNDESTPEPSDATAGEPAEGNAEAKLSPEQQTALLALCSIYKTDALTEADQQAITNGLNQLLRSKQFFNEGYFVGYVLDSVAKSELGGNLVRKKPVNVERMNRALLETAYSPQLLKKHEWNTTLRRTADITAVIGNANLALLISTVIAMLMLMRQRNLSRDELAKSVETALMSGGVIILITAGGGAFGAMLAEAKVGPAIETLFSGAGSWATGGVAFLLLGFLIAAILKIAQGSSTVAMIVGSGMVAAIIEGQALPYHPVYLATAIGAGSLVGSWMNDSGFWIFAKMGGLTEVEALKSWTVMLAILGFVSFGMTVLLSFILPLAG